ncbi:hypothetical protein K2Z83_06780 [Oscillochloris sp. ZM17-4]|nr:hypothetical protein [Oscillochloris sp. ZM17-4]MBX0327380.1 hypothetical protein [Oscillochloris sp. ZM17-4]
MLPLVLALILSGCELSSVSDSEQIANVETIRAGTPSATATATVTLTPTTTTTSTATVGPSPTATVTPTATETPLPPTPTPNPALTGFSFCNQATAGSSGRFSAQLTDVAASGSPAFEQVTFRFDPGPDSAPVHAGASCVSASDALSTDGIVETASPYILRVELPGWLRDERFRTSAITQTLAFTTTRTIRGASLVTSADPVAGATLLIGIDQALPYRLSVQRNPTRLTIAVARSSPIVSSSDTLQIPAGGGKPTLAGPAFFLYDGDIWRLDDAGGAPKNLTDSPESETALAVSPDGARLAFCRAAPGLDPAEASLAVPGALWTMSASGGDAKPLSQVGVSCADPAFSTDGDTVAFAVDETGALPTQRAIFTVPAAGGTPQRAQAVGDEWSRSAPQWLAGGALIYAAQAEDGRSTLFLRAPGGEVIDVGAPILVGDGMTARYRGFGRPLASPDGSRVAVEALRSDTPGADMLILAADGSLLDTLGGQTVLPPPPTATPTAAPSATATLTPTRTPSPSATPDPSATAEPTATPTATDTATPTSTATATPEGTPTATPTVTATPQPEPPAEPEYSGPYWTRPLAWDDQGSLVYMTTLCAGTLVQDYQIYRWQGPKRSDLIATGQSITTSYGAASFVGGGMAYVAVEEPSPGPRGPLAVAPRSPAQIWLWDFERNARGKIFDAERGISVFGS